MYLFVGLDSFSCVFIHLNVLVGSVAKIKV